MLELKRKDPVNYSRDLRDVQNLKLTEYLALQRENEYLFSKCLTCASVMHEIQKLGDDEWEVHFSYQSHLVVRSKKTEDFLALIDDFFLSFDSSTFWTKVPGSDCLGLNSLILYQIHVTFQGLNFILFLTV